MNTTKLTKKEKEAQILIVKEVEKAVNLYVDTCQSYCDNNKTSHVPIILLQEYRKILLKSYKKGAGIDAKD